MGGQDLHEEWIAVEWVVVDLDPTNVSDHLEDQAAEDAAGE